MSGPPNDAPPSQPFLARVTKHPDGTTSVTAMTEILGHQQRVAELLAAAQAFKDNPLPETEQALVKAALAL